MRRRLQIILLALVAIIALVLIVFVAFITAKPEVPYALPNPNGFDDLAKAGAAVANGVGEYQRFSQEELRVFVAAHSDALALARTGLARTCAVPIKTFLEDYQAMSDVLMGQKRLAQLLVAEGQLAELEDRPADAVRSHLDAVRLGQEISRGGFLINRLVGIACSAIGMAPLGKLAPNLEGEQLKPIVAELETIDRAGVTWEEVWAAEKAFMRHEVRKQPFSLAWLTEWRGFRASIRKGQDKHEESAARLRLLATELALRGFTTETGRPPAALDELLPNYLRAVPVDPFTERPLIYRPQGTNWLLYSVGPNRLDEGGKPYGPSVSGSGRQGDLFFDSR
ncbi:MAG: hypothetical protein KIS67_04835 [Verrucomicrobiae bacterium]|nr:hypothetical protein [Verrucomicrobiae bacterium]